MCRKLSISVLFVAGLFAVAAAGQPPQPPQPPQKEKAKDKKADFTDPTDAAVTAALANDPDVKIAKAKQQLAEAEVAKAKQAIVLKVLTLKATIEELKRAVDAAQLRVARMEQLGKAATVDHSQVLEERAKLETARSALAKAETEMRLLTSGSSGKEVGIETNLDPDSERAVERGLAWLVARQQSDSSNARAALLAFMSSERPAIKGPIPDRIRAALDKPVKLAAKGEKVTFEQALEVFKKDAGLDVPVRGTFPTKPVPDPKSPNGVQYRPIEIVSEGEELPVGAWFQLFEDNAVFTQLGKGTTRFRFYVREYGLFLTSADVAPSEAPALMDFWKQKPAAAPKKDAAPEPKEK